MCSLRRIFFLKVHVAFPTPCYRAGPHMPPQGFGYALRPSPPYFLIWLTPTSWASVTWQGRMSFHSKFGLCYGLVILWVNVVMRGVFFLMSVHLRASPGGSFVLIDLNMVSPESLNKMLRQRSWLVWVCRRIATQGSKQTLVQSPFGWMTAFAGALIFSFTEIPVPQRARGSPALSPLTSSHARFLIQGHAGHTGHACFVNSALTSCTPGLVRFAPRPAAGKLPDSQAVGAVLFNAYGAFGCALVNALAFPALWALGLPFRLQLHGCFAALDILLVQFFASPGSLASTC